MRGATQYLALLSARGVISTHAPLAGRDHCFVDRCYRLILISTHAPLAGRDYKVQVGAFGVKKFQPTRPLRGATTTIVEAIPQIIISTHAPLAGRDEDQERICRNVIISTHAPLAGRDHIRHNKRKLDRISTHAPLAGRDGTYPATVPLEGNFNPRAPCGARRPSEKERRRYLHFNPRAPCGARPLAGFLRSLPVIISTHAPLAGRDRRATKPRFATAGFQPTRPLRGATFVFLHDVRCIDISTHAPLAGRDDRGIAFFDVNIDFNPRAPCGARPRRPSRQPSGGHFNPRAPCGARPCQRRGDY